MVAPDQPTTNAEIALPDFTDSDLRNLSTLDDIKTILGGEVANASDYGNGFSILEDASRLCGNPLMILSWKQHDGDHGPFVSAMVLELSKVGAIVGKWIVNNGSMKSGLARQLVDLTEKDKVSKGLYVPNGLRRSDYVVDIADPETGEIKPKQSTTFYIDLTA
jgi:hypothetical protein